MAGKRFSEPTNDDSKTTINNVKVIESEYTSAETKKTISEQKTAETEKMMNSASTTSQTELITSSATGGIGDDPITDETEDEIISTDVKKSNVDQMKYVAQNNPGYFEEIGMNPDELLSGITGDTGITYSNYQEEDYSNLGTVIDENGFSYIETEIMTGENITAGSSTVSTTTGQNISGIPPRLTDTSREFVKPVDDKKCPISSGFEIRLLEGGIWKFHSGIDFGTGGKNNIICYAIYDGKISDSSKHTGYGNTVYLNFTYKNKKFTALYGHLEKSFVTTNQDVKKGDPIGIVGNTGGTVKDPFPIHLHFEIKDLSLKKWFNFKGSTNNTYKNRRSLIIGKKSLGFIQGSTTDFAVLSRFDGYLDPSKFLKSPSDFV